MNNIPSVNSYKWLGISAFLVLMFVSKNAYGQWEFVGSPERWQFGGMAAANDTIYLNTIGNIYYSVDTGANWQPVQEVLPFATINNIRIDGDQIYGHISAIVGLSDWYVSDDRGISWNKVPFCDSYPFLYSSVARGDTLIVSTKDSVVVSLDGGQSIAHRYPDLGQGSLTKLSWVGNTLTAIHQDSDNNKKIWRSYDLGATWLEGTFPYVEDLEVIGDHWWGHGTDSTGFINYYLISIDEGITWDTQLVYQIQDTLNSPRVHWCGDNQRVLVINLSDELIYSTTDNGETWATIEARLNGKSSPYWLMDRLWMNSTEQVLYSRIASSDDFGKTWTSSSSGIKAAPVKNIVLAEENVIWLDEDYTLDGGQTWHAVPNSIHQFASSGNGHMVGVYFRKIYQSFDSGLTWLFVKELNFPNELGYTPMVYYLGGYYIITYRSGLASMSSDGGNTWSPVFNTGGQLTKVGYNDGYFYAVREWDTVISEDFRNWTVITYDLYSGNFSSYIGGLIVHDQTAIRPNRTLFRLDLNSEHWQPSPFFTNDVFEDNKYPTVEHMIVIGDVIIAATFGLGVYISHNTGLTWHEFNDGLLNPGVNYLEHDDQFLYVGMKYGGLWRRPLADLDGYTVIKGHTFFDQNKNGLKETAEFLLPRVTVTSKNSSAFVQSKHDGSYTLFTNVFGIDTIVALSPHPLAEITTPPQIVNGSTDSVSFGVSMDGLRELKLDMTNVMPARPGFDFTVQLSVVNLIGLPADVRVVVYPDQKVDYIGANHLPSEITADSIVWIFPNMESSRSAIIKAIFNAPGSVGLNALLHFEAKVFPDEGDVDLSNNDASLNLFTVGAYDPNDKSVFPEGPLTPQMIADTARLVYTVRFQNLGTYHAERVMILDTLSEGLDISSLEIISASHDYTWRIHDERVLEVLFDSIFLPHVLVDELGSHGFVKYSINALSDLTTEDKITNQAHIYFDFNDPISTNIIESSIQEVIVSTDETKVDGDICQLEISPNPASQEISINILQEVELPARLQIVDHAGRIITSEVIDKHEGNKLDLRRIPSGMYSVIVSSKDQRCVGKIVKN